MELGRVASSVLIVVSYCINVRVRLAVTFTYMKTLPDGIEMRQALKQRLFLCELPLRRCVSCLPLLHARIKEDIGLL